MKPVTAHLLRALVALNFHPVVSKQPTLLVITTMAVDLFGGTIKYASVTVLPGSGAQPSRYYPLAPAGLSSFSPR
ncbi:hypothetical protein AHF37_09984 [Paragonimus kellicotti]|nr:hypothetical protein AHF37_09984 [Paragonimus kellicotti]